MKKSENTNNNCNLTVNFIDKNTNLSHEVQCNSNDLFVDVEKKLYEKVPKYRETNNSFSCKGKIILKFKTMKENNIDNGESIIMFIL